MIYDGVIKSLNLCIDTSKMIIKSGIYILMPAYLSPICILAVDETANYIKPISETTIRTTFLTIYGIGAITYFIIHKIRARKCAKLFGENKITKEEDDCIIIE
jgi:hypothetical protein